MQLTIEVSDCTGNRRQQVHLPAAATIGQIRPQLVEALSLDDEDLSGERISWILYNVSVKDYPILSDPQIARDVLQNGHEVRVVRNIIAGVNDHA